MVTQSLASLQTAAQTDPKNVVLTNQTELIEVSHHYRSQNQLDLFVISEKHYPGEIEELCCKI